MLFFSFFFTLVDILCEPPFRFRCDNNRCIYSHELCNSLDDCGDGTDEKQEHCEYRLTTEGQILFSRQNS